MTNKTRRETYTQHVHLLCVCLFCSLQYHLRADTVKTKIFTQSPSLCLSLTFIEFYSYYLCCETDTRILLTYLSSCLFVLLTTSQMISVCVCVYSHRLDPPAAIESSFIHA